MLLFLLRCRSHGRMYWHSFSQNPTFGVLARNFSLPKNHPYVRADGALRDHFLLVAMPCLCIVWSVRSVHMCLFYFYMFAFEEPHRCTVFRMQHLDPVVFLFLFLYSCDVYNSRHAHTYKERPRENDIHACPLCFYDTAKFKEKRKREELERI